MAIRPTPYVIPFNTNVCEMRATVAPPFRWAKQSYYRRAGRDREMRRPRVTADINGSASCQRDKTLQ